MNYTNKTATWFKKFLLSLFDFVAFAILTLWILLFIRFFVINIFNVVGSSMVPTFINNDFIVVDKISPIVSNFNRWDIIIFMPEWQDRPYIKRIIWLPWETVLLKDNKVLVCQTNDLDNCKILEEDYLPEWLETQAVCSKTEFNITEWYFVLGDNRWGSTDSRCCFNSIWCYEESTYEVDKNNIIWKVRLRIFPNFNSF